MTCENIQILEYQYYQYINLECQYYQLTTVWVRAVAVEIIDSITKRISEFYNFQFTEKQTKVNMSATGLFVLI